VVESILLPAERTRTGEQAREEIERTPGGVEIVPKQTIDESRAANLKDALDFVPGVLIRPRFGAADESQFSIRGSSLRNNFHLRGINVLMDGFPYGNADGFSDFESLSARGWGTARSTSSRASATRSCRATATTASRSAAAPSAPSASSWTAARRCGST
jgi:hypothetical protein